MLVSIFKTTPNISGSVNHSIMDQLSRYEKVEIPQPINSAYAGVLHGHHHHNHHDPLAEIVIPASSTTTPRLYNGTVSIDEHDQDQQQHHQLQGYNGNYNFTEPKKKVIRYKECQKNHAATMGGTATDGCGEFLASGEDGTIEGLTCSACNCHRNFHRKEIEGEKQLILPPPTSQFYPPTPHSNVLSARGRKVILGNVAGSHVNVIPFSRSVPINMSYPIESRYDDHDRDHDGHLRHGNRNGNGNGGGVMVMMHSLNEGAKKRFRTKFSQEQKEKMLEFAEKVGWKIQRHEENVVQQFCQEIGVKRRVLKVWMHNNKQSLGNKANNLINNNNNSSSSI